MSETAFIVGEIIAGIGILGVLAAIVTVVMTRVLAKAPAAMEILDERYARGELTRNQYRQMRQDLETTASRPLEAPDGAVRTRFGPPASPSVGSGL